MNLLKFSIILFGKNFISVFLQKYILLLLSGKQLAPLYCFIVQYFIAIFSKWNLLYTMLAEPYYQFYQTAIIKCILQVTLTFWKRNNEYVIVGRWIQIILYNIKHHIAINIKISMSYMITNTNNILPRKMLMILRIDKENTSIILLQYLYSSWIVKLFAKKTTIICLYVRENL